MKELRIRSYRAGDEQQIVDLWIECDLVVPQNDPMRDIVRKCSVNPEWFLIGEIGRKIIATCMAGYEGHRGWINYLAVSPEYRRRGIASRIMEKAEMALKASGCPKINLQVRETNVGVIRFYESIGYTIDHVASMGKRLESDEPYQKEDMHEKGDEETDR